MGDMSFALQLTVIALGALLLISLFFIGLTRGLAWLASMGRKEKEPEVAIPGERRKRALIAAAVTSYLEAESATSKGSKAAKSTKREGEDEEEIQDHHRG